jgi:hypothetical protein
MKNRILLHIPPSVPSKESDFSALHYENVLGFTERGIQLFPHQKPINERSEILFISSFPPGECGIATYSQDLIKTLNNKFSSTFSIKVCALESGALNYPYPEEVKNILDTSDQEAYKIVASTINFDKQVKLVVIQHELGFFRKNEMAFLQFIKELKKPLIIVFHTVLPHPEVVKSKGKKYLLMLEKKVLRRKLQDHVVFINKYLAMPELLEYLQLTDIYLFTANDPNQAVSGTFAYAMRCDCPIISTPIPHAKELLAEDTGIIFDFGKANQLAAGVIRLLNNEPLGISISFNAPVFTLDHLKQMNTEIGIIQFAKINQPDMQSGYKFLLSKTFNENGIAVISNKEWRQKGVKAGYFGEQPIDVAYTIMTLGKFYEVLKDKEYRQKMGTAFNWFLGSNRLKQIIDNPCTGGCYDGLEETHVNLNQGAESSVSYLLARLTIEKYRNMDKILVRKHVTMHGNQYKSMYSFDAKIQLYQPMII